MQVSPLLTPLNFNTRKRARSIEDYEAHYFKKRLISCLSSIMQDSKFLCYSLFSLFISIVSSSNNSNNNMNMGDVFIDEDDDVKKEEKEEFEVNNTASSRIKNININGSILPMEQRSGESKCRIPLFVLNDNL